MQTKPDKKDKKKYRLIIVLVILALLAVMVALWAVFGRNRMPVLTPDRVPEPEEHAEPMPDAGEESTAGGNSVSLTYSDQVTIDLSAETAALIFANPGKSSGDILLQIEVQQQILVQSGAIAPGNQVSTLDLLPNAVGMLQEGIYEGNFHLYFYDAEGERADVDTIIPITIFVKH